jgi:hypothetical protein
VNQTSFNRVIFPFLLVSILSLLGAWAVAELGFDYRYLLYLALFAAVVIILLRGTASLQLGFTLWIWMFLLGYRTIHITSYFTLHPLIVFLVLLFVILLFILRSQPQISLHLPGWVWIFSLFWVWGFITGAYFGLSWSSMIADALNFIFLIPLFLIVLYLSRQPGFWKSSMFAFLGVGVLISLLGSIEYYFPSLFHIIPGLVETNVEGLLSFSGFTRASFAFWGETSVGILCALSLPMVWTLPHFYRSKLSVMMALVLTAIIGYAVYLSGTRDAWLMVLITSIFIAYFALRWLGVALNAVFWLIASRFFSSQMWTLILSISTPLVGAPITDTSLQKRILRQQDAFQLALRNPLGVGWTGSGWVHGDFTQVAANLGILAGIIFILWYLHTLYRAWQRLRQSPQDFILQTLFLSFILCGLILATEGVEVLAQFVMPVWFVWALMEAYLQSKDAEGIAPQEENGKTLHPLTGLSR